MLGTCKNGHLTGQRHCGLCGADRKKFTPGEGAVLRTRYQLRTAATANSNGHRPFNDLRQGHRFGSRGGGSIFRPMTRSVLPLTRMFAGLVR